MFTNEQRTLLQQPLIARLSVNGTNGYPHTVPVWFMLDGDDIIFISTRDTYKVRCAEADPRAAVQIGGDGATGYLIKGDLRVEADREFGWMKRVTYHYEEPEQAAADIEAWSELDMIVLRMTPQSIVKVY